MDEPIKMKMFLWLSFVVG